MYKNTTALSVAISLALGTAAAVAPLTAQAEEQQVEKLQKMKVTGSRLTRRIYGRKHSSSSNWSS